MSDPWVMYYVVRKDRRLSRGQAMVLAGRAAVRCSDEFLRSDRWREAFSAWHERPRKVALRAAEDEFERVRTDLDCVTVDTDDGPTMLCLPPRRRSQSEPLIQSLRPYTDGPRPAEPPVPPPARPALTYVVRPGVIRTAGKAIAQAGHAALECVERHGDRLADWRAAGMPAEVREADDGTWQAARDDEDAIVVSDAGLTQVEPGTETVVALPPFAAARALVQQLPLVP